MAKQRKPIDETPAGDDFLDKEAPPYEPGEDVLKRPLFNFYSPLLRLRLIAADLVYTAKRMAVLKKGARA